MKKDMQYIRIFIIIVFIFTWLMPSSIISGDEILKESTRTYGMEATIPDEIVLELINRYQTDNDYMSLVDISIDKSKLIKALFIMGNDFGVRFTAGGKRQYQYINGKNPKLSDYQTLIGFCTFIIGVSNQDLGPGYAIVERDSITGKMTIIDFDYMASIDDENKWIGIFDETVSSDPINPENPFSVCHVLENLDYYSGKIIQIKGIWRGAVIEDVCETHLQDLRRKWPNSIYMITKDSLNMWDDPVGWNFNNNDMELAISNQSQFSENKNTIIIGDEAKITATVIGKLEAKKELFPDIGVALLGYMHYDYHPARMIIKEIKDIEKSRLRSEEDRLIKLKNE